MKKRLLAAVLSMTLCLSGGSLVLAGEVDNSARIAEIEAQIAELKAELRTLQGEAEKGSVVYQDDSVIISYDGIEEDFGGYTIKLIVENISDKKTIVQVRDTSINGFMVNPMCSIETTAGKKAKSGMDIIGDDATDNPMNEVETIETSFHIVNGDDYSDYYDTENIVINIPVE